MQKFVLVGGLAVLIHGHQLGRKPARIDLFSDLPGVSFEEVYADAIEYEDDDIKMKVIHVNHLIENKLQAG